MSLYNIIINLTGFSDYREELVKSAVCYNFFLREHEKIVNKFLEKKDKIELYYRNFERQTITPLKYSTEIHFIELYKKLYNDMKQEKEEALKKIDDEFNDDFNNLVMIMKEVFNKYVNILQQHKNKNVKVFFI